MWERWDSGSLPLLKYKKPLNYKKSIVNYRKRIGKSQECEERRAVRWREKDFRERLGKIFFVFLE